MSIMAIHTTKIPAFLISLFIVVLALGKPAGAVNCFDIFDRVNSPLLSADPLDIYDRLEERLKLLQAAINSRYGADRATNEKLDLLGLQLAEEMHSLEIMTGKLLAGEAVAPADWLGRLARIHQLEASLNRLAKTKAEQTHTNGESDSLLLTDLISDPTKVLPESPYVVELITGETISLIISRELAEKVFVDSTMSRVVVRSLKRIPKGIFGGGYAGDGIIRLKLDPTVVEVRILGKDGHFRFYGYLAKSDQLHLVHHTTYADHSGERTNEQVRRVQAIRAQRGDN